MVKKIGVFITILGLFFVGIPQFNSKAESYQVENLASPDLIDYYYSDGEEYLLYNDNGIILLYDVFTGVFTVRGETPALSGSAYILNFMDISLSPSHTYTFQHIGGSLTGTSPFLRSLFTSLDGSPTQYWSLITTDMSSTREEVNSWRIYLNTGQQYTFINYQFRIQVEQGLTSTLYRIPLDSLKQHYNFVSQNAYNLGYEYGLDEEAGPAYEVGKSEGFDLGYDEGFDDGRVYGEADGFGLGYDEGFKDGEDLFWQDGFDAGLIEGDELGYWRGLNEKDATGFVALLGAVFTGLGGLLSIEILPNIYIGAIIAVPLVFGIIFFILGKRKG